MGNISHDAKSNLGRRKADYERNRSMGNAFQCATSMMMTCVLPRNQSPVTQVVRLQWLLSFGFRDHLLAEYLCTT